MICRPLYAVVLLTLTVASGRGQPLPVAQDPRGGDLINDVDQSTVAMHPATPYLESSTLLLADVDLTKINVEATAQWLRRLTEMPPNDRSSVATVQGFLESLEGAGCDHVYLTAATRSLADGGPIVIVPAENQAVAKGLLTVLLQQLPAQPVKSVRADGRVVIAGTESAIKRAQKSTGSTRPDLILPSKRASKLDHSVVISLPDQARADLSALWPNKMPPGSPIEFSPAQLVEDMSSIVVSVRLPPDPELIVQIETPHVNAATRVHKAFESFVALGGEEAKASIEVRMELATLTFRGTPDAFVAAFMALTSPARQQATHLQVMNSLKQIGLAMHNYFDENKHLPPRCFTDRKGVPLHSVRVALLPFLDQAALYNAMRLGEPWNSDHNQPFSETRILTFADDPTKSAKTRIRFPIFPGSLWHGDGPPRTLRDVTDGTSNTIAAIHCPRDTAIEWSNPDPWQLSEADPVSDVFGDRDTACALLLDGSAIVLEKAEMTREKLIAMLTISGGELVE